MTDSISVIVCGAQGWGIGTTTIEDEGLRAKFGDQSYGMCATTDPWHFVPDVDCCTELEITRWRAARMEAM